jgi:predicted dehydrogenase
MSGAAAITGLALSKERSYARSYAANEKLNIGVVGVANQGAYDLGNVTSQNIVALCDVNDDYLRAAASKLPNPKTFNDFRKMLELKEIEAVVCATPDHMHATVTSLALVTGRHVYCEKPLCHNVWEVRQIRELTKKHRRVTQMGTQIHAGSNYRRVVELIKSGAIGAVKEVHVWCGGGYQGKEGMAPVMDIPSNLHWDLWLGPAKERPYNKCYVPFWWRGWWAFGQGTLGDLACHHMDLSHWALDLREPLTVEAEGPAVDMESTPEWLIVKYKYPARGEQPPVSLTWYNGDKRPHYFAEGKLPAWGNGTLFVGEKGMLIADYDRRVLLPEENFIGFEAPTPFIPDSIGHHKEWFEACKTHGHTTCNFDYSGALTEAVLLGNVAYRSGHKIEWDARHLKCKGAPEADHYLREERRKGWEWVNG